MIGGMIGGNAINIQSGGLNHVRVKRLDLIRVIQENLAKHIQDYDEAVKNYKTVVLKIAKQNLKIAKTDGDLATYKLQPYPVVPFSYESHYRRALRMLEMSTEDEIDLSSDMFDQLVLDDWVWKNSFIATNEMYKTL